MTLTATVSQSSPLGYFRVFAQPPGGLRREITMFRGAPLMLTNAGFSDPFTETTAQIALRQVTAFDRPGDGDLDWLVPDCDIDIIFESTGTEDYEWSWEGYIAAYSFGITGTEATYSVDLKGALYGLDDYLAIPSFPKRPIPYEILMAKAFDQAEHPAHLGKFRVAYPTWWETRVPEFDSPEYMSFLKPWGVATGQLWTGFASRSTGSWEPLLTGHVQSLLTVMFAEGGAQWTIRNRGFRRPELFLREIPDPDSDEIIVIPVGVPGIEITASRDFTQRATVIYGQGVDEAGISYSGMTVSPDGKTTTYRPFAHSPKVYPRIDNPNLDLRVKAKETMIRFQDGVDQVSAQKIAQGQFQRFAEPGFTGSVTLKSDVRYQDGCLMPRMLIRAGVTIRLKGILGIPEGILAHVTEVTQDFQGLTTTLTFDTKYRDALTVDEVKARTRDALTPMRALQVGKYSNTVQDLILPWSYTEGSGCVPMGAAEFFNEKLPSTAEFPYEEWTKKNPPKNAASAGYYVKINPTDLTNSNNNWSGVIRDGKNIMAIPIRMAQNGSIRLSQIAAYDKDGNILPVRFHVSVYSNNGASPNATPRFPDDPETTSIKYLKPEGLATNYGAAQANPFFEHAWEQVRPDGTQYQSDAFLTAKDAGLIVGWGTYFEPAGYSPGRASRGAERTGLLEDNAQWSWDLSQTLDMLSPENNANEEYSGMLFVQIYCDEQGVQPVYFMGRFYRNEPGTQ